MSTVHAGHSPLQIYSTLTRRKEAFQPLEPGKVRMYNCGPTVNNYFHVGNARNFVVADMIRRYLEYRGYHVTFVQNITDIEDKIIARAREEGCTAEEIAEKYTKVFFDSAARLGVREADHHPRATEYVGKMVALIKKLESKGFAYAVDGDVYFRVSRFADYGKLSGRKLEDLLSGARVEVSEKKESPGDFALWKAAKEGEPSWPSPWGKGRPGWHIECSVMAMDLLGETFDIHMGGTDLIFPHHENEIAQSEAATGKPFARFWVHNGFLNINGEKMSKSLGNFFTINQVLEKFEAPVVRYFLLSAHYRVPLDFSDSALHEAKTALTRLRTARAAAHYMADGAEPDFENPLVVARISEIRRAFEEGMDDDFNTPRALAALFEGAGQINKMESQSAGKPLTDESRRSAASLCALMDELAADVLGLDVKKKRIVATGHLVISAPTVSGEGSKIGHGTGDVILPALQASGERVKIPAEAPALIKQLAARGEEEERLMIQLIQIRAEARKQKNFALGDQIRSGLAELGFELLDRPGGVTEWKRK